MKVSLNIIKQFINVDTTIDELKAKVNSQLGTIEETIDFGDKYKDAVIVKVIRVETHPNADKLNICYVDDNGTVADVDRGDDGLIQVVCGAPNVHADMFAVWLPPRSVVPATYDDETPFILGARDLRGILSQGMLGAGDELAINNDHEGIVEISQDDTYDKAEIKPGANFAATFGLDGYVIDIENKMFTHRPDLFGQLGVAREMAGIQQRTFTSPDWYTVSGVGTHDVADPTLPLKVFNDAADNVPRFITTTMKNVAVAPSPLWLQCALITMGGKPINNVVDLTNYIMLLTAQPTHAYDYDKIRGASIGARMARNGETVRLLNDKTYELQDTDIVIADADGPIGLAGIMGGGDSEVSSETKNIVLEVANFNMYTLRKSSMRHGVFTDALTRFNKGQSPLQNDIVLQKLSSMIEQVTGATNDGPMHDLKQYKDEHDTQFNGKWSPISVGVEFINQRLGTALSSDEICDLLTNVEFDCHDMGSLDEVCVTAPFWRTDIERKEDIVEEVGRLHGFDRLPRHLPTRLIDPPVVNNARMQNRSVRSALSKAGANEVLTYSFVHENVMKRSGQDKVHAYQLANALSPDLQYYRLSLTPSLLDKVRMNYKAGYDQFALFETNKVHYKGEMDPDEPTVPNEDSHTALVVTVGDKLKPKGSAYYLAKRYAETIVRLRDYEVVPLSEFDLSADEWARQLTAPYAPTRSAVIVKDSQAWGIIGEFTESVKLAFKLPEHSAGFELHSDIISLKRAAYVPLSRYPSTARDVSFKVSQDVSYATIVNTLKLPDSVSIKITPIGIYQPDGASTKNITIRFTLAARDSTLSAEQANQIIEQSIKPVVTQTGAEII